jgi:hypothetical protein
MIVKDISSVSMEIQGYTIAAKEIILTAISKHVPT